MTDIDWYSSERSGWAQGGRRFCSLAGLKSYLGILRTDAPHRPNQDEAQAVDASTIARTSSGKLRPAARPALGTRLVAVMPGAVLTSRM